MKIDLFIFDSANACIDYSCSYDMNVQFLFYICEIRLNSVNEFMKVFTFLTSFIYVDNESVVEFF